MSAQYRWQREVHRIAASGLAWFMADAQAYPLGVPTPVVLPGDPPDTVWVERSSWGVWEFARSQAQKGMYQAGKASLLGHKPTAEGRLALYVKENGRPLAVAGDNIIRGDVKVPASGFRTAYINRVGYRKAEYVLGNQGKSEAKMPPVSTILAETFLEQQAHWPIVPPDQQDSLFSLDNVYWSFMEAAPLVVSVQGILRLKGYWAGYIQIRASEGIIVDPSAQLSQVILEAPYITMAKGASVQAQLWVRDSARLMAGSRLEYPSAVVLRDPSPRAQFTMESGSSMGGVLWGWFDSEINTQRIATLDPGATLVGQVYWPGGFEPQEATVLGQVVCDYLYLRIQRGQWINHLYGATLDARARPEEYIMPPLWSHQPNRVPFLDLP
ncbi:MAG TPA: hypothetical protein DCR93_35380 [Cytophagales bacterium]|nr:hypothetical protein [Cytophagales bacterium]HAP64546.1 hypothetical protein [Cytophagales bacterium]